jgi:hypothetical protein
MLFRQISYSLLTGALLLSADTRTVRFAAGSHVKTYQLGDVESIRFTAENAAAVPDEASSSPSPSAIARRLQPQFRAEAA